MSFLGGLFHDVQNAVSNFTSQAQKIISNAGQTIQKDLANIPKATQSGLAEAYKATRQGLTNLFLYSGAAGQEVGNFIKTKQFIPWNQAIQRAENQPVQGTPFSFLSKFGIQKGSQLYNAESSLATNTIPIVGTFGHLAAHPNEDIGSKISDIAFGVADILPVVGAASTLLRPVKAGGEAALKGLRLAEAGGEAASDIGSGLAKDLGKDLDKGSRLRNILIKIGKYGGPIAAGIGIGAPLALSFLNQNQGNNQNPPPSSPSSPSSPSNLIIPHHHLTNPSSPSSPSNWNNWNNYPTGDSGDQYPNNIGLYNPFLQGDQGQEAGTSIQNLQGNSAFQSPYYPSSPSSPSSPYQYYNMNYQSGSSSGEGFLSDLIHNKYFLIGAVVIILIIIGILIRR